MFVFSWNMIASIEAYKQNLTLRVSRLDLFSSFWLSIVMVIDFQMKFLKWLHKVYTILKNTKSHWGFNYLDNFMEIEVSGVRDVILQKSLYHSPWIKLLCNTQFWKEHICLLHITSQNIWEKTVWSAYQ